MKQICGTANIVTLWERLTMENINEIHILILLRSVKLFYVRLKTAANFEESILLR